MTPTVRLCPACGGKFTYGRPGEACSRCGLPPGATLVEAVVWKQAWEIDRAVIEKRERRVARARARSAIVPRRRLAHGRQPGKRS